MTTRDSINLGDAVRIRYGNHAGEIATVSNITWHSNQYGSYARVRVSFGGGEIDDRGMGDLEKVDDSARRGEGGLVERRHANSERRRLPERRRAN
jgi:hypothetical protein